MEGGLFHILSSFPSGTPREEIELAIQEYAKHRTPKEIREELPKSITLRYGRQRHMIKRLGIERTLFLVATGFTALEEITKESTSSRGGWKRLEVLFTNKPSGYRAYADTLRDVAKSLGLPALTKLHQESLEQLTADNVRRMSADQLRALLPRVDVNICYEYSYLSAVSARISSDPRLQWEVFSKITGITSRDEIGKASALLHSHHRSIATIITGGKHKLNGDITYFRNLARQNRVPIISRARREYIQNFSVRYVQQTPREVLIHDLDVTGHSVYPGSYQYSPFLRILSRKIQGNRDLQRELLRKWSGATTAESLRSEDCNGVLGYTKLRGLENLLRGKGTTSPERGIFFKSLLGGAHKWADRDEELIALTKQYKELRKQVNPGKIVRNDTPTFFNFGLAFEQYVGILLALQNPSIEHQIILKGNESVRIVDYGQRNLEQIIEVKSGNIFGDRDRTQLADYVRSGRPLVYILWSRDCPAVRSINRLAGAGVTIQTPDDLPAYSTFKGKTWNNIFVNKGAFREYAKTHDTRQLTANLFSVSLWVREARDHRMLDKIMEAAVTQDSALQDTLPVRWLSIREFKHAHSMVYNTESHTRYDDPVLRKNILRAQIHELQKWVKTSPCVVEVADDKPLRVQMLALYRPHVRDRQKYLTLQEIDPEHKKEIDALIDNPRLSHILNNFDRDKLQKLADEDEILSEDKITLRGPVDILKRLRRAGDAIGRIRGMAADDYHLGYRLIATSEYVADHNMDWQMDCIEQCRRSLESILDLAKQKTIDYVKICEQIIRHNPSHRGPFRNDIVVARLYSLQVAVQLFRNKIRRTRALAAIDRDMAYAYLAHAPDAQIMIDRIRCARRGDDGTPENITRVLDEIPKNIEAIVGYVRRDDELYKSICDGYRARKSDPMERQDNSQLQAADVITPTARSLTNGNGDTPHEHIFSKKDLTNGSRVKHASSNALLRAELFAEEILNNQHFPYNHRQRIAHVISTSSWHERGLSDLQTYALFDDVQLLYINEGKIPDKQAMSRLIYDIQQQIRT